MDHTSGIKAEISLAEGAPELQADQRVVQALHKAH
jgi:hypothetical protein